MEIRVPDGRDKADIVPLKFWTDYVQDGDGFTEVDYVKWTRRGSNGMTTEDKVSRVRKDQVKWDAIERYYDHWKKGQDAPVNGTPLEAWAGITREQIGMLKTLHLTSVEEFAEASDGVIVKINVPGIRYLQQKAKAFLANRSSAVAAEAIASRDQTIAAMQAQIDELVKIVQSLKADDEAEVDLAPIRRGPGRPPKVRDPE